MCSGFDFRLEARLSKSFGSLTVPAESSEGRGFKPSMFTIISFFGTVKNILEDQLSRKGSLCSKRFFVMFRGALRVQRKPFKQSSADLKKSPE